MVDLIRWRLGSRYSVTESQFIQPFLANLADDLAKQALADGESSTTSHEGVGNYCTSPVMDCDCSPEILKPQEIPPEIESKNV